MELVSAIELFINMYLSDICDRSWGGLSGIYPHISPYIFVYFIRRKKSSIMNCANINISKSHNT